MDFARDRAINLDKAVYLLSGFATADVVGRISCGWVADTGLLGKKTIMGLCCTVFGFIMQEVDHGDILGMVGHGGMWNMPGHGRRLAVLGHAGKP
ncbi:hypothetical protein HPB49_005150 [Dermacentor silvarum]|uniref:Uncharacterized protein n=1 Tax=Dermacentor silvarum TaxID=543639 RepID=A0ACB8CDH5_DERSI|nr:hypothetical protein HPB49_005150 [Dermacentor silvarum]